MQMNDYFFQHVSIQDTLQNDWFQLSSIISHKPSHFSCDSCSITLNTPDRPQVFPPLRLWLCLSLRNICVAYTTEGIRDPYPNVKATYTSLFFSTVIFILWAFVNSCLTYLLILTLARYYAELSFLLLPGYFIRKTNFTFFAPLIKMLHQLQKNCRLLSIKSSLHNSGQIMCTVSCPQMSWLEVSYYINPEILVNLLYISCYCLSLFLCLVPAFSISATEKCSIKCPKHRLVLGRILRWSSGFLPPVHTHFIIHGTCEYDGFCSQIRFCDKAQLTLRKGDYPQWLGSN